MNQTVNIGIDGSLFARPEFVPEAVFHLNFNHLNSLLSLAEDRKFIFFVPADQQANLKRLFPQKNVFFAGSWQESEIKIDHYHILDQTSFLPGRFPPLLTNPKTVKNSLMLSDLLPVIDDCRLLQQFPAELRNFYLHSLEMISACGAQIFCADSLLSANIQKVLSIPEWQISVIEGLNSVPMDFYPDKSKLQNLLAKFGIKQKYIILPADFLNADGGAEFISLVNNQIAELSIVCTDLTKYQLNFPVNNQNIYQLPSGVIANLQLTYFEWLELLYGSCAFLLASNALTSFGLNEASALQVPVISTRNNQFATTIIKSVSDLGSFINSTPERTEYNVQGLRDNWKNVAGETLRIMDSLL